MKQHLLPLVAACSILAAVPAFAQSDTSGGQSTMQSGAAAMPAPEEVKTAENFVPMAAISNMFEIESSKLALKNSQDENVRNFAQMMVDDHSAAAEKMKAAVQKSEMDITIPMELDAKHQKMMDQLQSASGDDFNTQYLQMQSQAHDEAIALFTAYSKNGEEGPIKEFAAATLPTLKKHKQMLEKITNS